ncbi:phosphopantetheine-binding protein [Lacrimispora brassicae]
MDETIEIKIREIVHKNIDTEIPIEQICDTDNLYDLGMNSFNLIKVVVALESTYGFEFPDEDLDKEKFKAIDNFIDYVQSKIDVATPNQS